MNLHRLERNRRFADRIKAILLLDSDWSYIKIAEALLLDDQTIRNYESTFTSQGIEALLSDSYRGGAKKLSAAQEVEVRNHIVKHTYHASSQIIAYVRLTYSLEYSEQGMVHLLHRLGFVYKKTKLVPGKADAEKQREFVKSYEQLIGTQNENDETLFMDGVHPQHNPISGYAWILKGKDKEIPTNTGRKRINLNGALNRKDFDVTIREDERINAQSTIQLFKQIEDKYPNAQNIHIIADNARYYRCKLVKEYLQESRIKLIFLPPYSPNLNLIERLWKFFKKEVIYDTYHETYEEFKSATTSFFENLEQYHDKLTSLLTEKFQIIGQEISKT